MTHLATGVVFNGTGDPSQGGKDVMAKVRGRRNRKGNTETKVSQKREITTVEARHQMGPYGLQISQRARDLVTLGGNERI